MVGMVVGNMHHGDLGDLSHNLVYSYAQDQEGNVGRILHYVHMNY